MQKTAVLLSTLVAAMLTNNAPAKVTFINKTDKKIEIAYRYGGENGPAYVTKPYIKPGESKKIDFTTRSKGQSLSLYYISPKVIAGKSERVYLTEEGAQANNAVPFAVSDGETLEVRMTAYNQPFLQREKYAQKDATPKTYNDDEEQSSSEWVSPYGDPYDQYEPYTPYKE